MEIDIEQDQEIAQAGGVNGTPTVQVFKSKVGAGGRACAYLRCACGRASPPPSPPTHTHAPAPTPPLHTQARVANLPGVKMKRDYKAIIEQHMGGGAEGAAAPAAAAAQVANK